MLLVFLSTALIHVPSSLPIGELFFRTGHGDRPFFDIVPVGVS